MKRVSRVRVVAPLAGLDSSRGLYPALTSLCESSSSAPSGLDHVPLFTHGSRRGLNSCAASRLLRASLLHCVSEILVLIQTLTCRAFLFRRFAAGARGLAVVALVASFIASDPMHALQIAPPKVPASAANPQKLFAAGEAALRQNKLDDADRDFRAVLAANPDVAGAYANLGVIEMRRKQWPRALTMLHKAEKLAPGVAGIRLNIGLVYFRQNDFLSAIKPFESVVKQSPGSYQAPYLLELCYFFNDRWADTTAMLEPLWEQTSGQLNYLYVLAHAAEKANNAALQERAQNRLVEIGQGTPEYRLIIGKAHYNRGESDDAGREPAAAAKGDPKTTIVHF